MNGNKWYGILGAMIGALIVLCIWVLNEVAAFRALAHEGALADERTTGLVERRYLELSGRIDKHRELINQQDKTDDTLVNQFLMLKENNHTHANMPNRGPSGQQ